MAKAPSGGSLQPDKIGEDKPDTETTKGALAKEQAGDDEDYDAKGADKAAKSRMTKIEKRLDALEQVNEVRLRQRGLID